jgi:thiol:disulfide interchange protein
VVNLVISNNVSKIKLDLTDDKPAEEKELERTKKGSIPLMIIYPGNPDRPGVFLDGLVSPADAIKALKYAIKYS